MVILKRWNLREGNSPLSWESYLYFIARDRFFSVALDWLAGESADDQTEFERLTGSLEAGVTALDNIRQLQLEPAQLSATSSMAADLRNRISLVEVMADPTKDYPSRRDEFHERNQMRLEQASSRHAS